MSLSSDFLDLIDSDSHIFVHGGAATPSPLLKMIAENHQKFKKLTFYHIHTEGEAFHARAEVQEKFFINNLFVGANMRSHITHPNNQYLPCFLSEIPKLFRQNIIPLDVALIQVSPPDKHGYCSLGTNVDISIAAAESAKKVIALVNKRMPRVHGDGHIHLSQISHSLEVDTPLYQNIPEEAGEIEQKVAKNVCGLIDDGATLQMGIGRIPNAVLSQLIHHKNLGVHTEMFSDGLLPLLESGAVNNSQKVIHPGKTVSGFVMGSQKLYDFIDDNPKVVNLDISFVNSPLVIRKNPKVTTINSAVEIDLTGQICADSVGNKIISGVGGQMDFMRGALLSEHGRPIIALSSRTKKGKSRIVSTLTPGAGVVTTRSHVHFVVTEYGVADLFGKNLHQRRQELIKVAHPEDRAFL